MSPLSDSSLTYPTRTGALSKQSADPSICSQQNNVQIIHDMTVLLFSLPVGLAYDYTDITVTLFIWNLFNLFFSSVI